MQMLCQEIRLNRPYDPDWIVDRVSLSSEARNSSRPLAVAYPFFVSGYLKDSGEKFYWFLPSITNWRYDLTRAEYDDEVLLAFGLDKETIVGYFDGE